MKKKPGMKCEIEGCGIDDLSMIHLHHIIERKEVGTSNDDSNLAILCSNHHNLVHRTNRLKIIGVFPSTAPGGRTLVYILDGKPNVEGITEPHHLHNLPQMKLSEKK